MIVLAGTTPRPSLSGRRLGGRFLGVRCFGGDYSPPFVERARATRCSTSSAPSFGGDYSPPFVERCVRTAGTGTLVTFWRGLLPALR